MDVGERAPGGRLRDRDRLAIALRIGDGKSLREIAAELGVHPSTVSREVARNGGRASYDPTAAAARAREAARRPKEAKLDADPALRAKVRGLLALGWSPEQVAAKLREESPDDPGGRVSHETIYRALYVQGRGSLREELACEQAFRLKRAARRPRSKLPPKSGRGWVEGAEIALRPPEADDRAVPGHWEGDLVLSSDNRAAIVTLVERKSRFLMASLLRSHESEGVVDRLKAMVAGLPDELARTLTWDQGTEMSLHLRLEEASSIRVYFCDPRSPWQRGTNENTNGLIREYIPKGTDFADIDEERVQWVVGLLNTRPRKTLGWRTPAEAFAEELESLGVA